MNFPERYKADIVSAVEIIDIDKVFEVIEAFRQARTCGRKIFVCANTRSASIASRVLCDIVMRSSFERPARFRILALDDRSPDTDQEGVSAERRFVEQLKNFAEPEDIVVGISAQDNSIPLLRAMEYAARIGCKTIALTGPDGGKLAAQASIAVRAGSTHLGTVEDIHIIISHMIGSYFLEFDGR